MKTVKFYTLGCKVNQYDTQSIRERFLSLGFKEIFNGKKANFYVINTCTVTSQADQKSRYFIRKSINENKKAKVIVTGCIAEKDAFSLSDIKGIGFIIRKRFFPDGISDFCLHTRAFLKIQDGCDNFCAYCKVPLVRGSSRSRSLDEIVMEAKALAKKGFKEIVLTGICLGSYGKDLKQRKCILDVISALESIEGLLRIRLSSIEARDVTDALIDKIASSRKLCKHLHIPIQSGDDEILKKMNRRYSRSDYLELIRKIKSKIPDIAITTDCLIGFPGESEENFQNTLDLVKEIMPLKVHIFPYSSRQGTGAFEKFPDPINPLIIRERISRLKKVADTCAKKYSRQFKHRIMKVLIEGRSKEHAGFWEGHSSNYIKVLIKSSKNIQNKEVKIRFKKIVGEHFFTDLS